LAKFLRKEKKVYFFIWRIFLTRKSYTKEALCKDFLVSEIPSSLSCAAHFFSFVRSVDECDQFDPS